MVHQCTYLDIGGKSIYAGLTAWESHEPMEVLEVLLNPTVVFFSLVTPAPRNWDQLGRRAG